MNFSNNFLLHLTLIDDIGPAIIQKITQRSDVQKSDLYLFAISDWIHVFGLSEKTASKIVAGLSDRKIFEQELQLIEKHNIKWITILDESYPSLLKEIHLPPAVLYYQGASFEENPIKCLAIVGSRKATAYGQRVINAIVPDLVAAGYTIISGGALGIDTMAHEATLNHGGKTIAVLGSGLLRPYPHANKKLFASIIENGGIVVSPYPLSMEPLPGNFPARNRIVTGLSQGCLVVQAAQKSGALISAHCALEQGREVFAIPGPVDDPLSAGCNQLIQQGAKLITCSTDILQEFGDKIPIQQAFPPQLAISEIHDNNDITNIKKAFSQKAIYSDTQKKIIATCKNPSSIEDIIENTQLSIQIVQMELFNLQLEGILQQDFSGMWHVNSPFS